MTAEVAANSRTPKRRRSRRRRVDFKALKRQPPTLPLNLGSDAQPIRPPVWQDYEPSRPGALSKATSRW
jgi:hypothetical protein